MSIATYRDGELDPTYKRKQTIKHIKYATTLTALVLAHYSRKVSKAVADKVNELSKPVRLDIFDAMYGTNLRAQHFSGLRTQRILKTKRDFGLI